ncbi:MAG: DUF523 and DUF1722 domain-containing protein [Methanolobus sp.]
MPDFSRPILVISKCLGFANCRYNGGMVSAPFIETMKPFVEFIDVCPECEIGLEVPREPIMIVGTEKRKLIQSATGIDLTEKMKGFSHSYLEKLDDFDGFILKSKSPSCGVKTTKVFQDLDSGRCMHREGNGFFAEEVLNNYPELPVIDEEQLKDPVLRDFFLTRVFALASFRDASVTRKISSLVEYQTRNKLLFMAYNKELLSEMGRLVGNRDNLPVEDIYEKYLSLLIKMLSEPAKSGPTVNAFMHAFGYFSRNLTSREKFGFMQKLQQYREDNSVMFELREWFLSNAEEFNVDYLKKQTLFCPYPPELSGSLQIV